MVVGLVLSRDQFALWHHLDHRDIRAFVEEFSGWEVQHAVVFSHDQETVLGPAHAVGHLEVERGRKRLHLVGNAVAVAVRHGPNGGFAGAHKQHVGGRCNRHVAGIWHHGKQLDLEAIGHLDFFQVVADRIGVATGLRHHRDIQIGRGDLHLLHGVEIVFARLGMHPSGQSSCEQSSTESGHFHRHLLLLISEIDGLSPLENPIFKRINNCQFRTTQGHASW